jgi:Tol biopolymer transport system component/predicted Ser/Thr protein kinase
MALSAGTRLGPYEILGLIGEGGMGEVYRATDTMLARDVAIKIIPAAFTQDADRMARFQREAQVLASLNHPNIAAIYGVEDRALVMELVEGPTLADRIAQGPLDEALPIARQIAEALEYAHERGIIHRDLKPANIKLTPESRVKLLDFGLAKALAGDSISSNPASSPTLTMRATVAGVILGTAAYMPPEQAKGKDVDQRADIWAFGVVLTEMLTGRRMYTGETASEVLAAVIMNEPDLSGLPVATPSPIRRLIRRCLDKDPKRRLQAIGEARIALDNPPPDEPATATAVSRLRPGWVPWAFIGTLGIALGFLGFRHFTEETRVLKLSVQPPERATVVSNGVPAVSPDGRRLAFVAVVDGKRSLWVRDLNSLAARPLAGTEEANDPFWSPDSRFLAFFAGGKLKKIGVAGGPVLTLCDAGTIRGGSWSKDDIIVFTPTLTGGLFQVPAAGGSTTAVTALDQTLGENSHRWPWFLPDGRHFLYTARNTDPEKSAVYVAELDSKNRQRVIAASSNTVYAPPGYLLFVRERTLMAQPFDASKHVTTGDPAPIAEQVDYVGIQMQGQFSSSQNGILAYTSGFLSGGSTQLTWFDRSGKVAGVVGTPGVLSWPAISPDGKTVALDRADPQTGHYDLWLHDLAQGTASRFTFSAQTNQYPVWSPDGTHIAFLSSRDGGVPNLYQKATSGASQDEALDKSTRTKQPEDWSRDGRYIIEQVNDPKTKVDTWVLPLFGDRKPFPYLQTEFSEQAAKLSPNGQWLAYAADETKRFEIYVQSFPTPGGKWQVSTNGGILPIWSRDGKELFFIGADGKLMAVDVKGSAKFEAGVPKPLFDVRLGGSQFDVSKDGRFLIPVLTEQVVNAPMTVVVNWTAELKK